MSQEARRGLKIVKMQFGEDIDYNTSHFYFMRPRYFEDKLLELWLLHVPTQKIFKLPYDRRTDFKKFLQSGKVTDIP